MPPGVFSATTAPCLQLHSSQTKWLHRAPFCFWAVACAIFSGWSVLDLLLQEEAQNHLFREVFCDAMPAGCTGAPVSAVLTTGPRRASAPAAWSPCFVLGGPAGSGLTQGLQLGGVGGVSTRMKIKQLICFILRTLWTM